MSRYLLEYENNNIVFESEEDLIRFIVVGSIDYEPFKLSKIESLLIPETGQLVKRLNIEKANYYKECKERILKEIQELDSKLDKIATELLCISSENIIAAILLKCEMEKLKTDLKSKEKEWAKFNV